MSGALVDHGRGAKDPKGNVPLKSMEGPYLNLFLLIFSSA